MIIDRKTFYAVAELVQAAAHQHGIVGPVEFHVLSSVHVQREIRSSSPKKPVRQVHQKERIYARQITKRTL